MDFEFSEEERMLQEASRRLLVSAYGFDMRARRLRQGQPCPVFWRQLAEQGLLALELPEAEGGLGAGATAVMLVAEAMGEALCIEPFLESALLATRAIATCASPAQRAELLPALASGDRIATLALGTGLQARREGQGWRLQGEVEDLPFGAQAELLLVAARLDAAESGLFVIERARAEAAGAGFGLQSMPGVDGRERARLVLDGLELGEQQRLPQADAAALSALADYAAAMCCAEALGCLQRAFNDTLEYTRQRRQFGQPIASFQAIAHRLAELYILLEEARSLVWLAVSRCSGAQPAMRAHALAAARVLVSAAAREIGQQGVQLHGGMGMSDELAISHAFKHLIAFERGCGRPRQALTALAMRLRAEAGTLAEPHPA